MTKGHPQTQPFAKAFLEKERFRWWRAVLLGFILSVPNAYWVMQVEGIWFVGEPTCISFFSNVGFTLAVLALLNLPLRKVSPAYALTEQEFVLVY